MKEAVCAIAGTKPASAAFKKVQQKKKNMHRRTESRQQNNQQQNTEQVLSLSLHSLALGE